MLAGTDGVKGSLARGMGHTKCGVMSPLPAQCGGGQRDRQSLGEVRQSLSEVRKSLGEVSAISIVWVKSDRVRVKSGRIWVKSGRV